MRDSEARALLHHALDGAPDPVPRMDAVYARAAGLRRRRVLRRGAGTLALVGVLAAGSYAALRVPGTQRHRLALTAVAPGHVDVDLGRRTVAFRQGAATRVVSPLSEPDGPPRRGVYRVLGSAETSFLDTRIWPGVRCLRVSGLDATAVGIAAISEICLMAISDPGMAPDSAAGAGITVAVLGVPTRADLVAVSTAMRPGATLTIATGG